MTSDPTWHVDVDYDVHEHGRQWAVCRRCGAQWGFDGGSDYEEVTAGGGYCEEQQEA
jgi:hypothetical protein